MDIICAKCGQHFNSIESARKHHCKDESSILSSSIITSNKQTKPQYSELFDDGWGQLFIPLPSDTILQKRRKVMNAIEYTLATQKMDKWAKASLEIKLNKLKYPSSHKKSNSYLTEDNDYYQELSSVVQELDQEQSWRQLFTKSDSDGYYYIPKKTNK